LNRRLLQSRFERNPPPSFDVFVHYQTSGVLGLTIGKLGVPQFLLCSRDATSCIAVAARSVSPTARAIRATCGGATDISLMAQ
jgi:hypothetical protein